jgi:hypothetical protein
MDPFQRPKRLRPGRRNDGSWFVKATWPNAPSEDVGYFESEAAAREWIATKADTYFRERKAVG